MKNLWASEYRRRLENALRGVEGFLGLEEAWQLQEAVRLYPPVSESVSVVEIGSWKGRSTIALALGVEERGNGTVHAIDPHTGSREWIEIYGPVDTYGTFLWNVERAGVSHVVEPLRETSHQARTRFSNRSVHVMFVDGSHEYEDVRQDVADWVSALADRAIVSFSDPSARGVYRALRECVLPLGSPFRSPRLIQNSLFFEFTRNAPWTARDSVALLRVRLALFLRYQANRFGLHMRIPPWLVRVGGSGSRRMVGG
jgi:MMP 1-O-methyltransferase